VTGWEPRDYVSPGLAVVRPDAAFPGVQPHDASRHPWRYTRREVPHTWYADERDPLMGVLNRDEAILLHNIALAFAGRGALEIGSWIGWSTAHLAMAGVRVDAIDPAHDDPGVRAEVQASLDACGAADRVRLSGGASPDAIAALAADGTRWSLVFVDGDHHGAAPERDVLACLPFVTADCAFVFHDVASPDVAAGLRVLQAEGFEIVLYQTAQVMGMAWRGDVQPVAHVPDPKVAWQIPAHLVGLPIMGVDAPPPRPRVERLLREFERPDGGPVRPTVCVVSNEILGPFRNGGIGTSMTGLAETLADEGFAVTILYTGNVWTPDLDMAPWRRHYAARGIALDVLDFEELHLLHGPVRDTGFAAPFLVHRYLAAHEFDVVHFNDCCGDGSLALVAKALGLAYRDALLVLALHSPSQWVLELNEVLPTSLLLTAYNYAERVSVRCADVVWSPSRYMLGWARDHGFALPEQTFVQQYSLPGTDMLTQVAHGLRDAPREIVFFGRLEERKGLRLFCNALQLMADELAERGVSVTFMGKVQFCGGVSADEYIAQRSADWRFPVKLKTGLDQREALAYLREGARLAVMPSPQDNSPCTVYEALCWGIPFLAARTGGIPELVDEEDAPHVLFEYRSEALRDALLHALEHGTRVARPAVAQAESRRALVALHERWEELRPTPPCAALEPQRWAAAVVDHRPGDDLRTTLDSLAACPWIKKVLVLDRAGGSRGGDRCVDLTREDPSSAARAILGLEGDDLLLVHSGVIVMPEPLSAMLGALAGSPVDGLLPAARVYDKGGVAHILPPLGGSAAFSFFEGVTFTGAMLVTRPAVTGALCAHALAPDSAFLGLADFCVSDGDVWPFPEVVVQLKPGSAVPATSALPARVAAYEGASPVDRYYMLAAGYGARSGEPSVARRREVALALIDLGLAPGVRFASWTLRRARAIRSRRTAATSWARLRR
jgi:glycosyltransferase involved in cell wall biosynthesis/predicted O-methyltransferase YrrM